MKRKLIIYGTGKFAEYVAYAFEMDSDYTVKAFCMEREIIDSESHPLFNKPLIAFEALDEKYPASNHSLFIAVGNNKIREEIYNRSAKMGYNFASYISSKSSHWENLKIGKNTFIDEGCVLQPFVDIGDNCILFTSNIAHHSKIGNHSLISVCTTGGNVQIGENCYIGMNSTIKQNVKISNNNVIGMGCILENDTEDGAVYTNKGTLKRKVTYEDVEKRFLK